MTKRLAQLRSSERGAAIAEYALAVMCAGAFGLALYNIVSGPGITDLLFDVVKKGLGSLF